MSRKESWSIIAYQSSARGQSLSMSLALEQSQRHPCGGKR